MSTPNTYEYLNPIPDISDSLNIIIKQMPRLIALLTYSPRRVTSNKHEYLEHIIEPEQTTLTAAVANGSATSMVVADVSPFRVNSIFRVLSTGEQFKVTAINSETLTLTIVRGYGSTTAAAIDSGATVRVVGHPHPEKTSPGEGNKHFYPAKKENYTQIFERLAKAPKTLQASYGINDQNAADPVGQYLGFQVEQHTGLMLREMNSSIIHGRKVARSGTQNGTMGGILQHMEGGNVVNASGNSLTEAHLGEAFEKCYNGGADEIDIILCSARQARKITDLYKERIRTTTNDVTGGNQILEVVSALPVSGFRGRIVVDPEISDTSIYLFARKRVVPARMRAVIQPGHTQADDFVGQRIIVEDTLECHGLDKTACEIKNLAA